MLALFSTVFILFGAPAILLLAGRLIQSATHGIHHGATTRRAVLTGNEWFCRAPQPLLGGVAHATPAETAAPVAVAHQDVTWFYRPMPPLVVWPDLRRLRRIFQRTASI